MQLKCQNLSVFYENTPVLSNISFSVDEGEYIAVIGENGSGKSTLIKALLGLIPYLGSVCFCDGFSLADIGYLPQKTEIEKGFPATVSEVALSGLINKKRLFYGKKEKNEVLNKLNLLGVADIKNQKFCTLSGGQQQRVLLVRALLAAKKMLVLDEPASSLDPVISASLYKTVERENKEKKITVLSVTHDINSAIKYADKILSLTADGYFFGTASDYIKSKGNTKGGFKEE